MCKGASAGSARPLEDSSRAQDGGAAWTAEQKAAIVAETCEAGALVSRVARRHGLTPQQLFAWRRQAHREADEGIGLPFRTGCRRAAKRGVAARGEPLSPQRPVVRLATPMRE